MHDDTYRSLGTLVQVQIGVLASCHRPAVARDCARADLVLKTFNQGDTFVPAVYHQVRVFPHEEEDQDSMQQERCTCPSRQPLTSADAVGSIIDAIIRAPGARIVDDRC